MKRFHVHAHVDDLKASIAFYSKLFAAEPTRLESDYAKWMIEDPRINFAISTRGGKPGVDHLGFQTDSAEELAELKARARAADMALARRGRDHLLLRTQRKALGHRPARHRLGALPHARQHPDVQPGQRRTPQRGSGLLRQRRAARQAGRRSPSSQSRPAAEERDMASKIYNVLFLCTGNSARIDPRRRHDERRSGAAGSRRYSAGSHPKGAVNPFALDVLAEPAHPDRRLPQQELGRVRGARTRRRWTSCSPSATAPPARPARSGRASR